MGKSKNKKGGGGGNGEAHPQPSTKTAKKKKARKVKFLEIKEKQFQEKKKKKEKLDKLRLQSHPKKRHHKPVGGTQTPAAIEIQDESDGVGSPFISFEESSKAAVVDLTEPTENDQVPWMQSGKRYRHRNVFLCLHEEILDFVQFLSPTSEEIATRKALVVTMEELVASLWPNATIKPFGSQLTQMFLPTSDIDMVVLNGPEGKEPLFALAARLEELDMVSYIEVVDGARIPIVKFVHAESGLSVDVSFGVTSGFATAELVLSYQKKFAPFRPLTLLLKYFLQQRGLNETFKGGVGSFLLQLMVVSFLQHSNRNSRYRNEGTDLGHLLFGFFDLYGNIFNSFDLTISVSNGGAYLKKTDLNWKNYQRPELLSMENPHDRTLDVGSNSFEIRRVFKVFSHAAKVLQVEIEHRGNMDPNHDEYGESILERIIALDDLLTSRTGPTKFGFEIEKVAAKHR
ncbi:unnamed protein product [Aphanomyces euteiches]|uniref:polynucleotide adenylyltransferase n=1 Tax=Aphanomyces euteiches TaxID=100861 RepID=A0A6G0W652_9STRA|nr:hypothetical protein Ae201684_018370 [Aphanomyces euteiches]KAH9097520.1 hypothetical protein Ae201684P_000998 [Aphanomyces euteiches]KAH9140002.1 hypothetical protein AeRB84_015727 [Aphanomyces euteiches]